MLKRILNKIDYHYILLFLIPIFLLLPLLNHHYFYGHDTGFHVANILSFSENLNWANLSHIKILPIIANNFGYGTNLFYPNLPHFIVAILYKSFPISVFTSIKITYFFLLLFSGMAMYKFMKTITKKRTLSFIATLFYITAPYRIYDYLYRDALAESFIFVFLPLVALGMYYFFQSEYKKFYGYFVLGYVGLIHSHLIMSIYVTIFFGIFLLLRIKEIWNKEKMLRFIFASFIVILLSLPFIIPLLTHMIKGNYVAFTKGEMSNRFGVYGNGLFLFQFLVGWKKVGFHMINWMALGLIIFILYKLKKEKKTKEKFKKDFLFRMGCIFTFLGIWLSSHLFPWFLMPNFLLMIQFPYRLGVLTSFGVSILAYFGLNRLNSKKYQVLCILSCILFASFLLMMQKYYKEDLNYYDLSKVGMGYQEEYLPMQTKNKIEYFQNRSEEVVLIKGSADIEILKNETPYLVFNIKNVKHATLELPRLFYFGYTIKEIKKNNEETTLTYQESENGFIEIEVDQEATIEVDFTNTKLSRVGNKISFFTFLLFLIYLFKKKEKKNEKRND